MSDYWEKAYSGGHRQSYPWDSVVSFVFRNAPREQSRADVKILEVGFGTGANLWFAAREGFSVSGIEASLSAVTAAKERFAAEGLDGDLQQGSFTKLPFADASFDLVVDRASLTCSPLPDMRSAIGEIARVAKQGAKFLFNPYADSHSSARSGRPAEGRSRKEITDGTLAGLDRITFLSAGEVRDLLSNGWRIESMQRIEQVEMMSPDMTIHAEWRVVAKRDPETAS